jgi:hypothetical protein
MCAQATWRGVEAQTFVLLVPHREGSVLLKINPHSHPPLLRKRAINHAQPAFTLESVYVRVDFVGG